MRFTYLSRSTLFIFLVVFLFLCLIGSLSLLALFILVLASTLFLFRRKKTYFHEDQVTTTGTVFSPISGKVVEVKKSGVKSLLVKMTFLDESGIYLPCTSEIKNLNFHSDFSAFRFSAPKDISEEKGTVLKLTDKKGRSISLQFIRFISSKLPELIILPGDRGRRQVNIGYFPFGGYVKVLLPEESEVVVNVGEKVIATETIVARFKDEE